MKRVLTSIIILIVTMSSLFAWTDSFNDNRYKQDYILLVKAIKDNEEEGTVVPLYDMYMEGEEDPIDVTIMEYYMVRYFKDRGEDEKAEAHLSLAREAYSKITEEGVRKDIAEIDLASADYYLTGSLSAGMSTSSLTKDLYKNYPEEISALLLEANRLTYSPHIGGGSPRRGLALFEQLLPVESQLQDINRFDLFAGLGIASQKRGQKENAIKYLETAISIYSGDASLSRALDELR